MADRGKAGSGAMSTHDAARTRKPSFLNVSNGPADAGRIGRRPRQLPAPPPPAAAGCSTTVPWPTCAGTVRPRRLNQSLRPSNRM